MSTNGWKEELGWVFLAILVSQWSFRRYEPSLYSATIMFLLGQILFQVLYYTKHSTISPFLTCLWINLIYGFGLTCIILLYRVSPLHPLASFPGPPMRRLSKLCALPSAWRGDTHRDLLNYHRKYGRYVRVGPNELSISDAAAVPVIYGNRGWTKGESYTVFSRVKRGVDSVQDTRNHTEHARRRRTWDKAFTTSSLASYQSRVRARARQLCDSIASMPGKPVDFSLQAKYFTWDVIFDLGFGGYGFDMLEKGDEERGFIRSLAAFIRVIKTIGNVPELAALLKILPGDPAVEAFIGHVAGIFQSKVKEGVSASDIFSHLIAPIEPSNSVHKNEQLLGEALSDCILLVGAGSDTTSSAIANVLFLLLTEEKKERSTYSELQQQIDRTFEQGDELDSTVIVQHIPLLAAVVNETMRLLPPVSSGPFQRVSPSGGATVAGHFIPERTNVIIPPYPIHHDPEYFPNPDAFIPERWMANTASEVKGTDANAYMTFSHGPYNCVGKQLALLELHLSITAILYRFDARLADGFDPVAFRNGQKDAVTRQLKSPLPIIFTAREGRR